MCENVSASCAGACWQEKRAAKTNPLPEVDSWRRPPPRPITAPQQRGGNWTRTNSCSYHFFSRVARSLFRCFSDAKSNTLNTFWLTVRAPPPLMQRRFSYKSSPLIYINGRANKHGVVGLLLQPP